MPVERKRKEDLTKIKETIAQLTKLVEALDVKEPHELLREGDTVRILTKGKIGSKGDIATVVKVNRSRVSLLCKGQTTFREAKNLRKV
jgi:alpha-D-ribose 1-methylphosphonate 5-triphosphate synthase subunit PhnG